MRTGTAGLVGREREIAEIEGALTAAAQGCGSVVVVGSGAGTGKTALLDAAVRRARQDGFTVLTARGSAAERDLPFGLANRVFESVPREPAAVRVPAGTAGDGEGSMADLCALHRELARQAAQGPVLLAVDDLQWVDRASLRWLSALPQRVDHAPIAVLLTVCPGEPAADAALLDEVLAASAVELHPAGLSAPDTATLLERAVGAPADGAFLAVVMRETAGNPLCVTELAAVLRDQAIAPAAAAAALLGDLAVPRLASRTHARLRRISPYALDVARAVAVLGAEADLARVTGVCGAEPPAVMEVLTALTRTGLLRVTGRTIAFAQPLLRTTLLRRMPYADLQTLHTRAARLLRAAGAGEDRVADQLMAAPALDEPWAAGVLRDAADGALRRGEPRRAAAYLSRALSEPVPEAVRAPLLGELARAEGYTDLHSAIRRLAALPGRPAGQAGQSGPGTRPEALRELAELLAAAGRHQAAVELLGAEAESASADLALCLTEVQFDAEGMAEAAAELLARLPRPTPKGGQDEGRYLSLLAMRAAWAGRSRAQAVALAQQAVAVLPVTPVTLRPALRAVLVLAQAGRVEDALERADALVGHAGRWQHVLLVAAARSVRGEVARRLGRLPAAADDARGALAALVECGAPRNQGAAVGALARLVDVLVDRGALDEAAALVEEAGLAAEAPATWGGAALLLARGRLRLAAGHQAEALRDLTAAGGRFAVWGVENPAAASWRSEAAAALAQLGEAAEARRLAGEAVEQARRWGAPGPLGGALRAQGTVLGGAQGLTVLKESVQVLERSAAKPELAAALTEYGTALGRARRTVPARRVLRAALELAEECGCADLARRSRIELTASGGRPPKSSGTGGVAGLTAAELRTAMLAAKGKTNRELAEILQVRQRTVEIHLTNAYRKLGIEGRDQLPAVLNGRAAAGATAR